jgi:drug/metabolite transporter (DMT)-like permease
MFLQRTSVLVALSLLAFAANSLLCRFALAQGRIDPASFTAIRVLSGALVLGGLAARELRTRAWPGRVSASVALFLYAAPFSFAYLWLGAGVGALVLFGSVQASMIGWGLLDGERASPRLWAGLLLAFVGLGLLTLPGSAAPPLLGMALMALAGGAWGAYSLLGRRSATPKALGDTPPSALAITAANFIGCALPSAVLLAGASAFGTLQVSGSGVLLAVASGALASGVGYSVWYSVLPRLSATRAATLQLLVPVLAALGGVASLGEALSWRLVGSAGAILGGVALAQGLSFRGLGPRR